MPDAGQDHMRTGPRVADTKGLSQRTGRVLDTIVSRPVQHLQYSTVQQCAGVSNPDGILSSFQIDASIRIVDGATGACGPTRSSGKLFPFDRASQNVCETGMNGTGHYRAYMVQSKETVEISSRNGEDLIFV